MIFFKSRLIILCEKLCYSYPKYIHIYCAGILSIMITLKFQQDISYIIQSLMFMSKRSIYVFKRKSGDRAGN